MEEVRMAGRGPAPKVERRRANVPERGEVRRAPAVGWQHGVKPKPPAALKQASIAAWRTWFGAWFAAFWTPADLPGLRLVIRLYDQVERGEFQRASELRLQMDTYGITPKGQQDRRWQPPAEEPAPSVARAATSGRYGHLEPVPDSA